MASPLAPVAILLLLSISLSFPAPAAARGNGNRSADDYSSQFTVAKQFKRSVQNVAAGEPNSGLWTQRARQRPLPTNKFWQNFVLNHGFMPEYVHPYTIHSGNSTIAIGYPKRQASATVVSQIHATDLVVSTTTSPSEIQVSRHDDLTVTLSIGQSMRVHLLRGSPYVSFVLSGAAPVIATPHSVTNLSRSPEATKHTVYLSNGQKWNVYSSSPINLQLDRSAAAASQQQQESSIVSTGGELYSGSIRIALVQRPSSEPHLDRYSGCYAVGSSVSIDATSSAPQASMSYVYKTEGPGELLLLSLPLHRGAADYSATNARLIPHVRYPSIDGELLGVVGSSWKLRSKAPVAAISWHSVAGVRDTAAAGRLGAAIARDVAGLRPVNISSTYFFGKAVARAARLALIAEEINAPELAAKVAEYLDNHLSPWFDGSNANNAIVYDGQWGGLVSQAGAFDSGADFGLGVYNDHHYHWGYFVYSGAVLAKLDPAWGERYRTNLYSLAGDYMSPAAAPRSSSFPRIRHFDPWVMHSWAGGLTEFADGRNQESTSEAVNAYYAAALLGRAFGDEELTSLASAVAGFESWGAKSLWHIRGDSDLYETEFVRANRMGGVVWANKRDTALWFAPTSSLECRVGIQVIPVTPVTEALFDDVDYNRQLYEWASPAVQSDSWRAFALAVQATYDPVRAAANVELLDKFDDGNSLSNMLWWTYTRPGTGTGTSTPTNTTTT